MDIDLARGVAVGALRSSVPQKLRPMEFAPVTIDVVTSVVHDELGLLYYSVLQFYTDLRGPTTRDFQNLKVAIDTTGLIYKRTLRDQLAPDHEYAYFADPDLLDLEEAAMRLRRGKNRREHLSFEKDGYIPAKPFVAPKQDIQLPLF